MLKRIVFTFLVVTMLLCVKMNAQEHAVRVNIPSILYGNINADLSFRLSDRFSLHLQGQVKPINYKVPAPIGFIHVLEDGYEIKHIFDFGLLNNSFNITLQPGIRFWYKGVYNRGFFYGLNAIASIYKYGGDKLDYRYKKGFALGGAISAGYSYEIARQWNVEAEIGIGISLNKYNKLIKDSNQTSFFKGETSKTFVFPSRLSLGVVYLF